ALRGCGPGPAEKWRRTAARRAYINLKFYNANVEVVRRLSESHEHRCSERGSGKLLALASRKRGTDEERRSAETRIRALGKAESSLDGVTTGGGGLEPLEPVALVVDRHHAVTGRG